MRGTSRLRRIAALALAGLFVASLATASFGQATWHPGNAAVEGDEYAEGYMVAQQPKPPSPAPAPKPKPQPAPQPQPPQDFPQMDPFGPSARMAAADPTVRLASVPYMFGDSPFGIGGQVFPSSHLDSHHTTFSDIPGSGAARRVKIAENNRALPTDRVFFAYNHFQNAIQGSQFDVGTQTQVARDFSIDQYTVGIEKTFFDKRWSLEMRMPFTGAYQANGQGFTASTSHYGDLALVLKRALYTSDTCLIAAGMGIDLPTGSDARGWVNDTPYSIRNEATNLLPFVGFLSQPNDSLFFHGFMQVDVPLYGDPVDLGDTRLGRLNDQTLMYLDFAMGYWLYRNRHSAIITGMAGVLEFHYTTTLQDADLVQGSDPGTFTYLSAGNTYNRVDVVNMTMGVHAQVCQLTTIGVGGVVPLDDRPDRQFDAEVQFFWNQRY